MGPYNAPVCTLAIYFQASTEFPLVVAANRDELYERAATAPTLLADDPWIVAGLDLVAGGTWLGVNARAMVAGIVNRRSTSAPDPTRRSRGQLCLDVLRETSVGAACHRIGQGRGDLYNPFNLLAASPEAACVIGNVSGSMTLTRLDPGLHLLTNLDLNDAECPRIAKSYGLFDAARRYLHRGGLDALLHTLKTILSDHSTPLDPRSSGPPNNLCVHTERFGTRSSTVVVYSASARRFRMWHANGPPCRNTHTEIEVPPPDAVAKLRAVGQG